MANNTKHIYVRFAQLHPLFTTALASASAFANARHGNDERNISTSVTQLSNDTDNVLLLINDENYLNSYGHRPNSMIITCMICAWVSLIVSVTICCFAQCDIVKRIQQILHGRRSGSEHQRDRTNPEPVEICRHFPPDYEVESLPSYTIVSGLPTYDDALEEFRKAGILLSPHMPVVKIFEKDASAAGNTTKEEQIFNMENGANTDSDNSSHNANTLYSIPSSLAPQVIELSPEQLATLSQKRLSLQITFNNSLRRNSRPRGVDLYRQVNRNNLLRSQAVAAAAAAREGFPQIHRSSSTLTLPNEPHMLDPRLMQHLQHRGSLY